MASPLRQFVAWSWFLELSNKSQNNGDYNGKADRHLTLMGQTEGTQENTVRSPTRNAHRLLTNRLFFSVDNLPVHKQQNTSKKSLQTPGEEISLIFPFPTGQVMY